MKTIYGLLMLLSIVCFFSCQTDDDVFVKNVGYLSLDITANNSTVTKAGNEEPQYNPKQLAVQILDKDGGVVEKTDDYTEWEGKKFSLPVGKYTVKTSSNGFDGTTAAWDKPYYVGSKEVDVVAGKDVTAEVICRLANVLVTVEFDEKFKESFKSATIVVADSADQEGTRLTFKLGENETAKAYFPVPEKSFIVSTSVTNNSDNIYSKKDTVRDVKARDNVRLKYQVSDSSTGTTGISIELDGTSKTFNFTIGVPTTAKTTLSVSANPWSSFAYFEGKVLSKVGNLDNSKLVMEYKLAESEEWSSVPDLQAGENDTYSARITGLTPAKQYQCRFVYKDTDEIASDVVNFETESANVLYNGSFDDWYQDGKTWYPVAQKDFSKGSFWDSSNPGTTQGMGAIVSINPTQGNTTVVHTSGGKSAELRSQYKVKFAAASLYAGSFGGLVGLNGAKINFGQPFTSRPISLHGFFQYAPVAIDNVGGNQPSGTVQKGDTDICSIYIALAKKTYTVDNTDTGTFIQFETDPDIIAYGELPLSECVNTNGQWKEFTIPLKYKNIEEKPTHIIIVASSSKYGDYFTGGNGSVMYLDDMSLIYEGEPVLWK